MLVLFSTSSYYTHRHPMCICACVELPPGATAAFSSKEHHECSLAPSPAWLRRHHRTFICRKHSQGRLLWTYTLSRGFSHVLLLHCSHLHEFFALFPLKLSFKGALNVSIGSLLLHQLPYQHIWIVGRGNCSLLSYPE